MVVREVNLVDLQRIINGSPIPVILEICTKHPICRDIQEHFNALSKKFNGRVAFIRIDVEKHPEVLRIFGLSAPSYIAFDRGNVINAWYSPSPLQLTKIVRDLSRLL